MTQAKPGEVTSPLYSTPEGFEAETVYGLFKSCAKWKEHARKELTAYLEECREAESFAAV